MNEVTGLDFCRSEPLKLATCSDDETVRVWTIDPLRVLRNSFSSPIAAAASGESPATSGIDHRNAMVNRVGRREGGASGAPAIRGVSGWTRLPVLPGVASGGEPDRGGRNGSVDDDEDDDDDPRGRFVSRGKFGLGTAKIGESSWWRRRQPGTIPANADGDGPGGELGRGGGRGAQIQAFGGENQSKSESDSESGGGAGAMDVGSPPARTHERSGADGGRAAVFCPRSPNKKAGAPRTPALPSSSLSSTDVGAALRAAISAAAEGTCSTRVDENAAPIPSVAPKVDGGLKGAWEPPERNGSSIGLGLERLDVDTGEAGVDRPAGVPQSRGRGLLDDLPSGWSAAKGLQEGARGQQRGEKQQVRGGGQKIPQKQKQRKAKKGTPPRDTPTLMELWSRGPAES